MECGKCLGICLLGLCELDFSHFPPLSLTESQILVSKLPFSLSLPSQICKILAAVLSTRNVYEGQSWLGAALLLACTAETMAYSRRLLTTVGSDAQWGQYLSLSEAH